MRIKSGTWLHVALQSKTNAKFQAQFDRPHCSMPRLPDVEVEAAAVVQLPAVSMC